MLTRRIIACLDVRDGQVVKGVRFRDHVVVGAIEELAARYRDEGADELVFYDIGASPGARDVDVDWVGRVARLVDIPFCVAGGIRCVEQARRVLGAGADKISVNTPALERPALVAELAEAFGVQCVVVGMDSLRDADGDWRVRRNAGDPARSESLPLRTLDWITQVQSLGAGEIVLNCIGSDGAGSTSRSCRPRVPPAPFPWSPRAARATPRISPRLSTTPTRTPPWRQASSTTAACRSHA
jgi:cyclase